jgi:AraC family transcriptional activator of tynA and feaB
MAVESWVLDDIPAAERAEAWRHVVSDTHLPWALDRGHDPAPVAGNRIRRRALGDLQLVDCVAAPCSGRRERADLRATDGEHIGVLLIVEGTEVLAQEGHEVVLRAGDLVAWDSVRPARFAVLEPLRKQTLLIPRARFRQLLPRPELVTARRVPATPTTAVLRGFLDALPADGLDPAAAFAAGNAALELVGAALGSVVMPSRAATRDAVRVRIRQHIEAHLDDREALRPQRLAAAHAISVRTLHALFRDGDDTVGAYVRRRRLARARADLIRAPWPSVTAVAHRWAFSDAANFSRAFRAAFGVPPSEAQRTARASASAR